MKKGIIVCLMIIIGLPLLLIFAVTVLPWLLIYIGLLLSPNPPAPQITYGEFPFRLEYKIGEETILVEDTVICQYDGVGMNEGVGKYRKWKHWLASTGGTDLLLLEVDASTHVYYSLGSAECYMGDKSDYRMDDSEHFNRVYVTKSDGNREWETKVYIDADVPDEYKLERMRDEFDIELISWEPSPPIENSFSHLYMFNKRSP